MSAPPNDNDLLPEQTQGFKVGEKKTMDEINNLGKQSKIVQCWLSAVQEIMWYMRLPSYTLFCVPLWDNIYLGKFKDASKLPWSVQKTSKYPAVRELPAANIF